MFTRSVNIVRIVSIATVIVAFFHYFIPQSWGFYTIQANHPIYNIYTINNGVVEKDPVLKNNFTYGMGISKKGKILYGELYSIINKKIEWKFLNEDSLNFLIHYGEYGNIPADHEYPDFKGDFLIIKTARPHYLDLKNKEHLHSSRQYVLAHIR